MKEEFSLSVSFGRSSEDPDTWVFTSEIWRGGLGFVGPASQAGSLEELWREFSRVWAAYCEVSELEPGAQIFGIPSDLKA